MRARKAFVSRESEPSREAHTCEEETVQNAHDNQLAPVSFLAQTKKRKEKGERLDQDFRDERRQRVEHHREWFFLC